MLTNANNANSSNNANLTLFASDDMAFGRFLMQNGFRSIDEIPVDVLKKDVEVLKKQKEEMRNQLNPAEEASEQVQEDGETER